MTYFWIYFENGFRHILNIFICNQILFLMALSAPYAFKDWKKILLLISVFTIGNLTALLLSFFDVISIKENLIRLVSPSIIVFIALLNIFGSTKSSKPSSVNLLISISLIMGVINGFGFADYFNTIAITSTQYKSISAFEFCLGIEMAQIIIVIAVLLVSYIFQSAFRFSKRDWVLMLSSFVMGIVLPLIINNDIWKRFY